MLEYTDSVGTVIVFSPNILEEAFGGLIRNRIFTSAELRDTLKVIARKPLYRPYQVLVEKYMREAKPKIRIM